MRIHALCLLCTLAIAGAQYHGSPLIALRKDVERRDPPPPPTPATPAPAPTPTPPAPPGGTTTTSSAEQQTVTITASSARTTSSLTSTASTTSSQASSTRAQGGGATDAAAADGKSTTTAASEESSNGLSSSAKVGIGVGIGLLVLVALLAAAFYSFLQDRRGSEAYASWREGKGWKMPKRLGDGEGGAQGLASFLHRAEGERVDGRPMRMLQIKRKAVPKATAVEPDFTLTPPPSNSARSQGGGSGFD